MEETAAGIIEWFVTRRSGRMTDHHVCTCGVCAVEPYDDRCKYELAGAQLMLLNEALPYLREVTDEGPEDEGWKSQSLQRLIADIEELIEG